MMIRLELTKTDNSFFMLMLSNRYISDAGAMNENY